MKLGTRLLATALIFSMGSAAWAQDHIQQNALFRDLLEKGAFVTADRRELLPRPSMPDGLDAAGQAKMLEGLASEGGIAVDEFTRNSVVARFVQRLDDVKPAVADGAVRRLDLWFVAYAPFEKLVDKSFLDRLGAANGKDGAAKPIALADLAKRGINLTEDQAKSIGYGHVTANLMNRVELRMTGHSQFSRTADSVAIASFVDDRFSNDAEFPNQWKHLTGEDSKPVVYHGGGYYMKLTRLIEPKGALLIESHSLFVEPTGWFDGGNTLRSKLPAVMENQVRSVRRELLKLEQ